MSRLRPRSSAPSQAKRAAALASTEPLRSPAANSVCGTGEIGLGGGPPQPHLLDEPGVGQARVARLDVGPDRHQLRVGLGRRRREPCLALERGLDGSRGGEPGVGRGTRHGVAIVERSVGRVEELLGLLELPGAHRLPHDRRQLPLARALYDLVVLEAGGRTFAEQARFPGPDDPGSPQIVVRLSGLVLEQVEEPAPVRRPGPWLGSHRCRAKVGVGDLRPLQRRLCRVGCIRLVGANPALGRVPDGGQAAGPGALGDEPGKFRRARIAVVLGRGLVRPDRSPGIERDLRRRQFGRQRLARDGLVDRCRRLERVPRREALVRPAIGEEAAVEPGVGGLVEDDERIGVVGDLDPAGRRVVAPRVARGRAADRLGHDERPLCDPWQADLLRQDREAALEQAADSLAPGRIVGPGSDADGERLAIEFDEARRLGVVVWPLRDEVGEEAERLGEPAAREDRPSGIVGRRLTDVAGLDLDRVAGREDDGHAAARRGVAGKGPRPERHEAGADANLPGRRSAWVRDVEGEGERPRRARRKTSAEVDPEERPIGLGGGDADPGAAAPGARS